MGGVRWKAFESELDGEKTSERGRGLTVASLFGDTSRVNRVLRGMLWSWDAYRTCIPTSEACSQSPAYDRLAPR